MKSKKLIALALAAAIILAAPTNALAAEVSVSGSSTSIQTAAESDLTGTCGDNLTWSLDETTGVLTISGEGDMYDYTSSSYAPWYSNVSKIRSVEFNGEITSIGNYAFNGCTSLTSITIGDSVTSIGDSAFAWCYSLTSITIPDSVTSIGERAFLACDSFTSINVSSENNYYASKDGVLFDKNFSTLICCPKKKSGDYIIPDSVTSIGDDAFGNCDSLTSITIPDSVTSIGNIAFDDCDSLTSITIPDSVTSIGDAAFYYCTNLTSVTIGNSVSSIGGQAFYKCSSLTSITIPDSVTSIGNYAFYGCDSLKDVYYTGTEEDWTNISIGGNNDLLTSATIHYSNPCGDNLTWSLDEETGVLTISGSGDMYDYTSSSYAPWYSNRAKIKSVKFNGEITSIGNKAFYDCDSLTSVTIPGSVTSIGDDAFYGCTSLTSITIGDSVTSIGDSAFAFCTSLTSITIPDSVTSIGDDAFLACDSFTSINVSSENKYYASKDGVLFDKNFSTLICCPKEKSGDYIIPDSVTSIGDDAFAECTSLTSITIPDSVTSIGNYAFNVCSSLTSITIPDSVTSIGGHAFRDCSSLTSITIPDSVTSIGNYAFYGCDSLKDVYYTGTEEDWTNISIAIGGNNDLLTSATIHYSNPCGDNLTWSLDEETGVLTISGSGDMYDWRRETDVPWYSNREKIKSVEFNGEITSIGDAAFYECSSLTSITIPDSVTSIGYWAFYGCNSLTSINVSSKNERYASQDGVLFDKNFSTLICCPEGKSGDYIIPDSVTSIGDYAFMGCSSLTSITIPDSVTSIGNTAFRGCSSLTSITIPDSVTSIGNIAFSECTSLTSIIIPDSVTSIGDYAFYKCDSLKDVYYTGTEEDWANKISIGSDNAPLTNATIHYGYVNEITSITLDKTSMRLKRGEKSALTVTVSPSDLTVSTDDITWTSSDNSVATVSETGEVKGITAGKATITATAENGVSASCEVTVRIVSQYYTVNVSSNYGGIVFPKLSHKVKAGGSDKIKILPYSGYKINKVTVNGEAVPVTDNTVILENVEQDSSVYVEFADADKFNVTVTANDGGHVSHLGTTEVISNDFMIISVIPKIGYRIKSITKDGISIDPSCLVLLKNINENHTVDVEFEKISSLTKQDVESAFQGLE